MNHHLQKLALAIALTLPAVAHANDSHEVGPKEEACLHSIPAGSLGPEITAQWEAEHHEKLTRFTEPCQRERQADLADQTLHPIYGVSAVPFVADHQVIPGSAR